MTQPLKRPGLFARAAKSFEKIDFGRAILFTPDRRTAYVYCIISRKWYFLETGRNYRRLRFRLRVPAAAKRLEQRYGIGITRCLNLDEGNPRLLVCLRSVEQRQ